MTVGRKMNGISTDMLVADVTGEGFQIVWPRKRKGRSFHISKFLQIKGKSFEMTEVSKPLGLHIEIIECRPHLVRSILLPLSALPWLIQTLAVALHLQWTAKPMWSNRSEQLSFRASVLSNPKGRFFRIVEELPAGRFASICIPEGPRSSGCSSFHQNISLYAR